jgi:SAM-dependent methyltransferase
VAPDGVLLESVRGSPWRHRRDGSEPRATGHTRRVMIAVMSDATDAELDRIRAAYRARDAAPASGAYGWTTPAFRLYMQQLEWALLEELARAGLDPAGRRVLEVGCGSGYFLARMLDYGAEVACGIDLMESRVETARERYPRLDVVAGDASAMPYADGAFDLVTQFTCLSSVLDPDLRRAIAAEMWRVVAPGGAVVSYDMRGTPALIRLIGRWRVRRAAHLRTGTPAPVTATTPIRLKELRSLFPHAELRHRSLSLPMELSALTTRWRVLAEASTLPFLHTHLLAIARKRG